MRTNGNLSLLTRIGGLPLLLLLAGTLYAGSSKWQITTLAVSSDGKLLALTAAKDNTSFIYIVPVDTGVARRLTDAKGGEENEPSFSADGKRIAYSYEPDNHRRSRIAIVNVDGSDMHEWSPSSVTDLSPILSPDNETIVFSRAGSYGSYSRIAQSRPHDWSFYAANLDGTNVRELTTESFYRVSRPSVSSDGKKMVVVAEGLETEPQIAIYSVTSPGLPVRTFRPHVPKEMSRKHPIFAYGSGVSVSNNPDPFGSDFPLAGPDYSGFVHDTGGGWDYPGHVPVPPGDWIDIWLPSKAAANKWGRQWRWVTICTPDTPCGPDLLKRFNFGGSLF